MKILRMGEAPGRDSRPETLRGRRRAVPKKEGVKTTRPGSIPRHPQGKEEVHSPEIKKKGERATSRSRAPRETQTARVLLKKAYITI